MIKNLLELKIIDTLRLRYYNKGAGNINIYRKAAIRCENVHSNSIIVEKGCFNFNASWIKNDPFPSILCLKEGATLNVKNDFSIYSGSKIYLNEDSMLILGSGYINSNLNLSCFKSIKIGHNVAISENVIIRDSDNHTIRGSTKNPTQPIAIGNDV